MLLDDWLYCPVCADVRAAEVPDCPDGHGRDCPDRACAECGTALFVGPATSRSRSRRSAVGSPRSARSGRSARRRTAVPAA